MFQLKLSNFAMPIVFLLVVCFVFMFGESITYEQKSLFYTISLIIKDCLIFFLPVVIFSLVFNSISRLGTNAIKSIILITMLVCCSNFTNIMLSYVCSLSFQSVTNACISGTWKSTMPTLTPMYQLNLPRFISNDVSLLAGILCGFMSGFMKSEHSIKISSIFANFQKYFFKTLIPLMPFFIFGTVIKLQYDGILDTIYSNYMPIMLVFIVSAYGLILFEFLILSSFKLNRFVEYVRNIIPAVVVGFGSMSSAAALPLLVKAAKDNSKNKDNADIIAPTTVNIHLVGDCFFTPMVAISIISYFGLAIPSLPIYCKFAFYFMIAKFAVAAVPGGGILVALPILQNYLGFNADMLGLITALYVLFDSIITACNVAGNGAMAVIFDRIVYVINERNTISHKKTLLHKEKDKGKAS